MAIQLFDKSFRIVNPILNRIDAQVLHHGFIKGLRLADNLPLLTRIITQFAHRTLPVDPVTVGGVDLPFPLILSAGLVKGDGFISENDALAAVFRGKNIMPGWRVMPALVGSVEFGSFTRYPRVGNAGTVLWRRGETRSTQNRIGLKNPGANAAADFLSRHADELPSVFGINIAVSPGVSDPDQEETELVEALAIFTEKRIFPAWFTVNLSCPNTEDDPTGNQTAEKVDRLSAAAMSVVGDVPLWLKVSPCLGTEQYDAIIATSIKHHVQAVIATNTLGAPTPDGKHIAGIGGGELHTAAVEAVSHLMRAKDKHNAPVDIIACGGVMDGQSFRDFQQLGVQVAQYYSAIVFRSPLAPILIYREANQTERV